MLKIFALCLTVLSLFFTAAYLAGLAERPPAPNMVQPPVGSSDLPVPVEVVPPLVREISVRNETVSSMSCDHIVVKIWGKGARVKLTGSMYYEKPKNLRFRLKSLVGQELDIGSNKDSFWYWSRRDKSPGLHFAAHEDLPKCRMKTPFTPMWLIESLCLGAVKTENVKVSKQGPKWLISESLKDSMGRPIVKTTYVNSTTRRIDGYTVHGENGKPQCLGEVLSWDEDLPAQILYVWAEENVSVLMDFSGPKKNRSIGSSVWSMPEIQPRLDMGKE
jgi:hypothetical protein